MEGKTKKILIGVIVVVIIVVGATLLYRSYRSHLKAPSSMGELTEKPSPPEPAREEGKEGPPTAVALPDLNQSDDYARRAMKGLSPQAKLAEWLKIQNIIRVITASVDNIANGLSPRPHLGFLSPGKAFLVNEKKGKIYLDPQGYKRYDLIAVVFASLDAAKTIKVYQELKPLFQQAYRELGYPDQDFEDTLIQAIQELLSTPVVKGEILLTEAEKGINYEIVDEYLENLSEAQRHLLRMGPENTQKIQKKLREMALALGAREDQLPRLEVYIPPGKRG